MEDIGHEPALEPPEPKPERCAVCGGVACYGNTANVYCPSCMADIVRKKFEDFQFDDLAEILGYERIVD